MSSLIVDCVLNAIVVTVLLNSRIYNDFLEWFFSLGKSVPNRFLLCPMCVSFWFAVYQLPSLTLWKFWFLTSGISYFIHLVWEWLGADTDID